MRSVGTPTYNQLFSYSSHCIDIKIETVEELKDGNKTGKKFKYADYQVKGNKND